jgi:PhnB protein
MNGSPKAAFAPQLIICHVTMDLEFYKKAFDAVETKHLTNEDGSIHVSEMFIVGAMFHFHEESYTGKTFSPTKYNGVTAIIGLMVDDVDSVMERALAAGAKLISPAMINLKAREYRYNFDKNLQLYS